MSQGRVRQAARTKAPLRDANFLPKRERKRIRKSMVRGYVANKVSDARIGAKERAEFYRNLRQLKMRRRKIASEMAVLADMVSGLRREVSRTGDRSRNVDIRFVDEAHDLAKVAESSVGAAADEFHTFSRARVWFTEAMAA